MSKRKHQWAEKLAALSVRHPWKMLTVAGIITVVAIGLSEGLEMRMNWSDTLPANNPIVKSYREVQDRFGDAASLVVALEGDYNRITAMADILELRLKELNGLHNVQGRLPLKYFREHGFSLLKPNDFERMLRVYADPSLIGTFRGVNNDYEREYTDNESNMRRDEVDIARSMLGMHRALEVLVGNFAPPFNFPPAKRGGSKVGANNFPSIQTAVDAISLGEPWLLSLDRRMLLIVCETLSSYFEFESLLTAVEETEQLLAEVRPMFPDVAADLTGIAKVGQDEMNSVGIYTLFLSLGAILLIYLLLSHSFHGWILPIFALLPLLVGIFWTMGLLYLLFGSLNIFTSMIMLVLLGLGIDFSIHTISRFNEEIATGKSIRESLALMLNKTGIAVLTGGLTTAAAFLTLLIGESAGVYEFGAAAGFGVLLTLLAVFLTLPPLLTIRRRKQESRLLKKGIDITAQAAPRPAGQMPLLGKIARSGWRRPALYLVVAVIVCGFSIWARQHIDFEYDFLELEPKGLKSIQLQREIPKRFGMSDHAAWVVTNSVEESRELKEKFKKKPLVGDVAAISDYIPSAERLEKYKPKLMEFRKTISPPPYPPPHSRGGRSDLSSPHSREGRPGISSPHSRGGSSEASSSHNQDLDSEIPPPVPGGGIKGGGWSETETQNLFKEINRLWDNLDLMSNLAYAAGLDRIVQVIDGITGTETETGEVDTSAVLPTLSRILEAGVDNDTAQRTAIEWEDRLRENLYAMSNPVPVGLDDLPEVVRRSHLPRKGDGFLIHVVPRKYLFSRKDLDNFAEQTTSVSEDVCGTEQLIVVMFDSILTDGKNAALLALLVIVLLVLIHFRGPIGLLSLIPLATGALSMIGLMYLIGEKYNYMNLMAVPIILGIGIDDGIHALHRFRNETGSGIEQIYNSFSHVGRAILLTSLTTMIGFGSIAFYTMEGMASFGRALFMGVGACFLATIFVLPAVLRLFTRNK